MNYKSIIKSRKWRLRILTVFRFIPDVIMIKFQYRIKTNRRLNLINPRLFTEKIQWYKLYYHDPLMTQCADKYRVREYVKSKGLESILPKLHGVYKNIKDISFEKLPKSCVIKSSIGGGGNDVIVIQNLSHWPIDRLVHRINQFPLGKIKSNPGREWAYLGNQSLVMIEENLNRYSEESLTEYKFYTFNGRPQLIKVSQKNMTNNTQKKAFYDIELNPINVKELDGSNDLAKIEFPKNIQLMIEIVERLGAPFPHVRVDLYNINESIYFGEMTFYDMSGYVKYSDPLFDQRLGDFFELPNIWN